MSPNASFFRLKIKPGPVGNFGQASVMSITHSVVFFGDTKHHLDGMLAFGIQFLDVRCLSYGFYCIQIPLPDMPGQNLLPLFIGSAFLTVGTAFAVLFADTAVGLFSIFVGSGVP